MALRSRARMLRSLVVAGWGVACAAASAGASTLQTEYPADVAALMDQSVDPCEDFYQYSCGGWLESYELPGDVSGYSYATSSVEDNNREMLLRIYNSDKPIVSDLYKSCMNLQKLNAVGTKPVHAARKRIAEVRSTTELFRLAGKFARSGPSFLTVLDVMVDPKNASRNVLNVDQPTLTLGDPDFYADPDTLAEYEHPYRKYITNIFALNGVNDRIAASNARTVIQLEKQLAQILVPADELDNPVAAYNPMPFAKAVKKYPMTIGAFAHGLNLLKISSLTPDDTIIITTPDYFDAVEKWIAKTSVRSLQVLLEFKVLDAAAFFMGEPFLSARFEFHDKVLYGQHTPTPRANICAAIVQNYFPALVGKYYFDASFSMTSEQAAQSMVNSIEKAMKERIQDLTWLDDTTREAALKKLSQVTNLIGHAQKVEDFTGPLNATAFFANMMAISLWASNKTFAKIGQHVDRKEWDMSAADVNAYYDAATNQMVFPAGILQPPFFDPSYRSEQNFGAIGAVMGHELIHGFDDSGREYDGAGNLSPWWTKTTNGEFEKRAKCIEDQYSGYQVVSNDNPNDVIGKVDGRLTLGENIADNGGLSLAMDALHEYLARMPSGGGTPSEDTLDAIERLFYVSYAQSWCSKNTDETMKQQLSDVHAPDQFRVNGVVQNDAHFSDLFECKSGSPMNPKAKCQVW